MAAVHILTLSTSLLDFYGENIGLSGIGDSEVIEELGIFQAEIEKARAKAMPSDVRIRWEVEEDTSDIIKEFAQEQNKLINL